MLPLVWLNHSWFAQEDLSLKDYAYAVLSFFLSKDLWPLWPKRRECFYCCTIPKMHLWKCCAELLILCNSVRSLKARDLGIGSVIYYHLLLWLRNASLTRQNGYYGCLVNLLNIKFTIEAAASPSVHLCLVICPVKCSVKPSQKQECLRRKIMKIQVSQAFYCKSCHFKHGRCLWAGKNFGRHMYGGAVTDIVWIATFA